MCAAADSLFTTDAMINPRPAVNSTMVVAAPRVTSKPEYVIANSAPRTIPSATMAMHPNAEKTNTVATLPRHSNRGLTGIDESLEYRSWSLSAAIDPGRLLIATVMIRRVTIAITRKPLTAGMNSVGTFWKSTIGSTTRKKTGITIEDPTIALSLRNILIERMNEARIWLIPLIMPHLQ